MSGAGKSVDVQERHAIRASSTKNKARNNKVYTARGPKDRRIRLSADIAIQFYDVQDRLGYERASEAVDWLIHKAKGSIDKLVEDSSLHQEFEQHLTNSGPQNNMIQQGDYYFTENCMSENTVHRSTDSDAGLSFFQGKSTREDCRLSEFINCSIDSSSMLFPYIQMSNNSENHHCFEHSSMQPFQQMDEKGQISRMIMLNSKLNSRNEVHPFIPSYVPLMSSSVDTTSNPTLNLCLPSNNTSEAFTDSEQWTIF